MRNRSAAMPNPASAHPTTRGYALAQVNRPTERTALRRVAATPADTPDLLALFDGIINAHTNGDRHGLSLLGHAIARLTAETVNA